MGIVTMDSILKSVLAAGNKEQNQMYPPAIFEAHFNLVSSFLLDEIAKLDPTARTVVDMGKPFFERKQVPVTAGLIPFPADYRHLRGIAVFATLDFSDPCASEVEQQQAATETDCCGNEKDADPGPDECIYPGDPLAETVEVIKQRLKEGKCRSVPVRMVDHDEWDLLTTHPYKYPTLQDPIGCIFEDEGIRICPLEIPNVELRYIRQPQTYVYGYALQPDDTYQWIAQGSVESEWTDNAKVALFKGITTLYATYTRDGELRDATLELKKAGLI